MDPQEIGIQKYKEMLMAKVKDALEILGYGSKERMESEIFGIARKQKKRGDRRHCKERSRKY